ncbi:MAG: indolepyruvate ferredoxin oxidoreductase family protein [Variovorax sp.]|nr:MAG: indolepyruvate ferredoxin oxidoreductase family protein [Variovorax sp.]
MNAPTRLHELIEDKSVLSGTQALARLPLEQRARDQRRGLNTGCFISGYRGSPLGTYDQELWRMKAELAAANIHFQPGVNEDLAATAVWGTQYVGLYPGATVDGVFGIWYGKTPGVDRSMDALHHANTAGTSPHGGVLALAGDDHAAKSSSRTGQSDQQLRACGIPVLYPSSVQEILEFGLHGIAMSRFSGCWTGLKLATDVVETSSAVRMGDLPEPVVPEWEMPPGGVHIRANETPQDMEARLYESRLPAVLAYARANRLNRIEGAQREARFGIVSAGKSWGDVRGALSLLGLDEPGAARAGLRLLKLGMTWPLDEEILMQFAEGLDHILVVEEKRPFLEEQIKSALFNSPLAGRVRVSGKAAPGAVGLPVAGELSPHVVARTIATLANLPPPADISVAAAGLVRMPNFCSGCPHNTSTVVPEGSRAMAGIGCHGMAMWIRPESTGTVTHMGGEGMLWVGQRPFTTEEHVFANIGDGTFFHSGSLALRQAVAAKARITYKLLFNGYVSMTGGQPHDGELNVRKVVDIVRAEGVGRVVVVADDPSRHAVGSLPPEVTVHHRRELDAVQRDLREFNGVSVLVYDQACATEMRRQRKRKPALDVAKRTWIHPEVCEGCGDCGVKSNCMSVEPLETELGRKRRINQSSCNKDFSCVEGFCPSFVTVQGGRLRRRARAAGGAGLSPLPAAALPSVERGYNVVLAGIGGTGIVTVGAILAQAALMDGLQASVLDLTGMAQKYGAVMSHLRIATAGYRLPSSRLSTGEADLVIGCDLIVTAGQEALSKMAHGRSKVVVNSAVVPTGDFTRSPDWDPDAAVQLARIAARTGDAFHPLDAERLATALMGDAIATNMFLLGHAWQRGYVPVSLEGLDRAIAESGVDVDFNRESFEWGRRSAAFPHEVENAAADPAPAQVISFAPRRLGKLEEIVADRVGRLKAYQGASLVRRYEALVERAKLKDAELEAGGRLARAVARSHYKLLAHKDEYEVARLFSQPEFRSQIETHFEGDYKLHFHLGAWPLVKKDSQGHPQKREVGPWMLRAMGVLQHMRHVRDTWLDPLRNTAERVLARQLLDEFEKDVAHILAHARSAADAIELAELPEKIRGYGHVRERHAAAVSAQRQALRASIEAPVAELQAA